MRHSWEEHDEDSRPKAKEKEKDKEKAMLRCCDGLGLTARANG